MQTLFCHYTFSIMSLIKPNCVIIKILMCHFTYYIMKQDGVTPLSVDPSRCNSIDRQNQPFEPNCCNFLEIYNDCSLCYIFNRPNVAGVFNKHLCHSFII